MALRYARQISADSLVNRRQQAQPKLRAAALACSLTRRRPPSLSNFTAVVRADVRRRSQHHRRGSRWPSCSYLAMGLDSTGQQRLLTVADEYLAVCAFDDGAATRRHGGREAACEDGAASEALRNIARSVHSTATRRSVGVPGASFHARRRRTTMLRKVVNRQCKRTSRTTRSSSPPPSTRRSACCSACGRSRRCAWVVVVVPFLSCCDGGGQAQEGAGQGAREPGADDAQGPHRAAARAAGGGAAGGRAARADGGRRRSTASTGRRKITGAVYHDKPGMDLVGRVYGMFAFTNLLTVDPRRRPDGRRGHPNDTNLYRGGDGSCGAFTTGGTESILMAMKSYRGGARDPRHPRAEHRVLPHGTLPSTKAPLLV